MSSSKSKTSQKGKSKSKKTGNLSLEDSEEFPSLQDDSKKTQASDQKSVKGKDGSSFDNEQNQDTEEKTLEDDQSPATGVRSRKNETNELRNARCFSLSSWFKSLPFFSGSQSQRSHHQNGVVVPEEIERHKQNLFQKLEPYQLKINSYSTAFVIRTKILILAIFWLHVLSWLGLSLVLGFLNILTFLAGPWSLIPILGWYFILLCHFFITHRLLKGAGQNDLEWVDTKIWEYVDRLKELSSQSYSTCKERSQFVVVQTRTTLSNGLTYVKTYTHGHIPEWLRQKTEGQKA